MRPTQPRMPTQPISSRVDQEGTDPSIGHAKVQECMARGPRVISFYEERPSEFIMRTPDFQRNCQDFESRRTRIHRPRVINERLESEEECERRYQIRSKGPVDCGHDEMGAV